MDSYTEAERVAYARKVAKWRAQAEEGLRGLQLMARSAHAEGVSEVQLADQLGVGRMTIRKWLGKR